MTWETFYRVGEWCVVLVTSAAAIALINGWI